MSASLAPLAAPEIALTQARTNDKSRAKSAATAQDFESMVLSQMMAPMWETVEVDPDFGGGHAEETMRSVMVQEYGKAMARAGGVGIARLAQAEILRLQEAKSAPATASLIPTFANDGGAS